MTNPVSALTTLALATAKYFREANPGPLSDSFMTGDAFLDSLIRIFPPTMADSNELDEAIEALEQEPDLKILRSSPGKIDPMILSVAGGSRQDFRTTVLALLTSAAQQLTIRDTEMSDATFAKTVLENYEELKRAARGEHVRGYRVRGIAGINLPAGTRINTPWGTIRGISAEPVGMLQRWGRVFPAPQTTAILDSVDLIGISISRKKDPKFPDPDNAYFEHLRKVQTLTPLLFAMSSPPNQPAAAIITFETTILPFTHNGGYSSSFHLNPFFPQIEIASDQVKRLEDLAKVLFDKYHDNLQIASTRIVSAISQRMDKADSLIDAVMAWESLVGGKTETVFRVTSALTLLLEPEPTKRSDFRKRIANIYDVRSRVVHGEAVEPQEVMDASAAAIDIALQALNELYKREGDWLSMKSDQRAERLIFGY